MPRILSAARLPVKFSVVPGAMAYNSIYLVARCACGGDLRGSGLSAAPNKRSTSTRVSVPSMGGQISQASPPRSPRSSAEPCLNGRCSLSGNAFFASPSGSAPLALKKFVLNCKFSRSTLFKP